MILSYAKKVYFVTCGVLLMAGRLTFTTRAPCPVNPPIITVNRNNTSCQPVRTRFCYRSNCQRCCYFHNSCNPYPGLLVSRQKCKRDLCGAIRCKYPGEYCDLTKDNIPKCHCPESCPEDDVEPAKVCGTDGVTYKSTCVLNRTACLLGMVITVKFSGPCDLKGQYLFISPLHQKNAILDANQPGKLKCSFLGDPISITWTKLEMDSLPPRMIPIKDTLVIPKVRIADEGTYRCEAYDGLSVVESFVKVTVDYDTEINTLDYNKKPKATCLLPRRYGYCTQHDVRWYFDVTSRTCQPFVYSGCGKNDNNFKTEKQCKSACEHWAGDVCQLPLKTGPCQAHIPRWYYDKDKSQCTRFVYGGCRGNANRFPSKLSCEAKCKAQKGYMPPCIKLYMNAVNSHRKGLFTPRCTPNGQFQKTQCHGSVCFCMDSDGMELQGTRVPNGQFINCTLKVNQCRSQKKAVDKNPFSDENVLQCKADGTYENVQCSPLTGQCWCVDIVGNEINGTRTRGRLTCPTLDAELTNCQRHYIESAKSPRKNEDFFTQCAIDGRYHSVQCRGNTNVTCACVDQETGELRRGMDVSISLGYPQCSSSGGLTLCQRMHQEAIRHPEMSNFIPQCTEDGRFEHVQCNPDTKACWCVDNRGMEITGSKVQGNLICPDMDSKLSPCQRRYQHAMKRLSYKINYHAPRCKPDGTYEEIQCHGRACHCVDKNGVEIPYTRVTALGRKPNCTHPDTNLTPCEKARYLSTKGNQFVPRCRPDGSWQIIQCEHTTKLCWCIDEKGLKIKGKESKGPVICPQEVPPIKGQDRSRCWAEYVLALRSRRRSRRLPWCKDDGRYNPIQCHGSFCHCVTENGVEVPGSRLSLSTGRPTCQSSGDSLTQCQIQYRGAMLSGFIGGHVPRCKSDGQYEEVQCQAGTSLCWCVDENGQELPGTRTTKDTKCPAVGRKLSPCQQMYLAYARNPSPDQIKPRCTLEGMFETVQCKMSYCFCVDVKGVEIPGTKLHRLTGKPTCNYQEKKYLTSCQQVAQKVQRDASIKGLEPRCKRDGRYEEVQCSPASKQCWCVDEQGREVAKTRTKGYIKCPSEGHLLTPCRRAYQETLRRSLDARSVPQCTSDGGYDHVQCHEDYCYCVNEYGVEIADSRVSSTDNERPNCLPLASGPTLCKRQLQRYIRADDYHRLEPSCNADGSYRDIQCYGSQCYCVDTRGVEIPGTRKNFIDGKPNCEKKYISLTLCQQYLQEVILRPSKIKIFLTRCGLDGQFEPIQCSHVTGYCWCVDINGKEIKGTRTRGIPQCTRLGVTTCWRDYISSSNASLPGSFTPWCTNDGAYRPLQVQGSRYFCVNELGHEVLGTSVSVMDKKPNCKAAASSGFIPSPCQLEQIRQKYTPRTSGSYTPRCKTDGSYDEIQCDPTKGQCWCVDKDGMEMDGMRSSGLLICPSEAPLTRCHAERKRALRLLDYKVKLFIPRCKADGSFEDIQCHGLTGQCWCVDNNGIEIIGSLTFGTKPDCVTAAKMTSCERHRVVAIGLTGKSSPSRYVPQCTKEGKYNRVQCHSGTGLCWCVDPEGHEVMGTRAWGLPKCQASPKDSTTLPLDIAILYPPLKKKTIGPVKTYLQSLVSSLNVSPRSTHLSLVVSSEKPYAPVAFSKYDSQEGFNGKDVSEIIDAIKPDKSTARIDRGLNFMDKQIFNVLNGMRGLAHKVMIVLMDAKQIRNQGRYTPLSTASEGLKLKNIYVYAIGVTPQIDVTELIDIASRPGNVFTAKNYENLALNGREIVDVVNNDTRDYLKDEKLCNLPLLQGRLGCFANLPAWYYSSRSGQCLEFSYSGCGGNANNFASYEKCRTKCGGTLPMCHEVKRKRIVKFLGQYRPSCHHNGRFAAVQCFSKYCWCSNRIGVEIPGTRVHGIPVCDIIEGKTTECLEERRKALGRLGVPSVGRHAPDCDPNGNYRATQTNGNSEFRWCVDPEGYPVSGTQRWGRLNCTEVVYKLRSHKKDRGKTQCERERIKSNLLDGGRRLFNPNCKQDGSYEEIQCYGKVCWCVDHHGNEIMGTRQRGAPNCTQVALLSACHREYKRSMILHGIIPLGLLLPHCSPDGKFEPIQCHSATGYCWCVDEAGNELLGTRQWGRPNCTNAGNKTVCDFRRKECEDNQPTGYFVPKCTKDGGFEQLQCLESMKECWCVDHYGYELAGTRSPSHHRPNCKILAWLSPCQIQRRKALGHDGLPVVGLFVPECKHDGSYEPVQCHHHDNDHKFCWCVNAHGVEVLGSRRPPGIRPFCGQKSLCKELRNLYSSLNTSRFVPQCQHNGRFNPIQCQDFKDMPRLCWCVDEYGNEIYSTMSSKKQNCSDPGLSVCQHNHNQALIQGKPVVPRCNIDGSYADMQCDSDTNECWCVDRYNNEIKNTRRRGKIACESREEKEICKLPQDPGPCKSNLIRWYFESSFKLCLPFVYGGCAGNENKFISFASCQEYCKGTPLTACQQARSISEVLTNQHKPSCDVNGSYKSVQCDHVTKQCWCADKGGREIQGYRTTNGTAPVCPGIVEEQSTTSSPMHGRRWLH